MKRLENFYQKLKVFLGKLQNLDEPDKRQWVFFLSLATMVLVVFFWWKQFVKTTLKIPPPPQESFLVEETTSFWQTMKNGWEKIRDDIRNTIEQFETLTKKVQLPEEIIIK